MSTIAEYLESLRGKSIAVIGMGVSNTPLIRMLLRSGLKVTVCDKAPRERVEELAAELESLGAKFQLGQEYLSKLSRFDVIFRTPGLSPNTPELRQAVEKGSELTSEMELFFRLCPCRILGVTGSDGKTTTTTLISEFLKEAGYNVYIGGNIGKPLLPDVAGMVPEDMVVVELSSFQLMSMDRSPNVAVFTNLSPDHISPAEHLSFEEYRECKLRVLQSADTAVINADDPSGAYMMSRLRIPCFTVSSTKGDYVISHESSMRDGNGISTVFTVSRGDNNCRIRVRQPGMYSAYNAALAYAACRCENVEAHDVTAALGATVMRGRFEMIPLGAGRTAVIDCAHNKASLQAVLEVVRAEARKNGGRVLCLVGAPGGKAVNRRIGLAQAASGLSDIVILTSDNPDSEDPEKILDQMERGLVNGFKDYFRIADRESAIRYAVSLMRQGDVLLLAGKGNEDYQLVNGVKIPFSERGILAEEALGAPV